MVVPSDKVEDGREKNGPATYPPCRRGHKQDDSPPLIVQAAASNVLPSDPNNAVAKRLCAARDRDDDDDDRDRDD